MSNDPSQGPVSVFSARTEWTAPRLMTLTKDDVCGFGFTIKGEAPSVIVEVEPDSPADVSYVNRFLYCELDDQFL